MMAVTVPCRHGVKDTRYAGVFFMGKHYARRVRIITTPSSAAGRCRRMLAWQKDTGGQGKQLLCLAQGTGAWFFCPHLPNIFSRPASVVLPGQGGKEMLA